MYFLVLFILSILLDIKPPVCIHPKDLSLGLVDLFDGYPFLLLNKLSFSTKRDGPGHLNKLIFSTSKDGPGHLALST